MSEVVDGAEFQGEAGLFLPLTPAVPPVAHSEFLQAEEHQTPQDLTWWRMGLGLRPAEVPRGNQEITSQDGVSRFPDNNRNLCLFIGKASGMNLLTLCGPFQPEPV